jgi:hypothetical protein
MKIELNEEEYSTLRDLLYRYTARKPNASSDGVEYSRYRVLRDLELKLHRKEQLDHARNSL